MRTHKGAVPLMTRCIAADMQLFKGAGQCSWNTMHLLDRMHPVQATAQERPHHTTVAVHSCFQGMTSAQRFALPSFS